VDHLIAGSLQLTHRCAGHGMAVLVRADDPVQLASVDLDVRPVLFGCAPNFSFKFLTEVIYGPHRAVSFHQSIRRVVHQGSAARIRGAEIERLLRLSGRAPSISTRIGE
jgi:hypothetical protein